MKNIFFILFALIFLTGCAQNLVLLGPTYSVVKTGGIQHAIVAETINYGVKSNTGKNISEHGGQEVPHLHFHLFGGERVGKMVE